MQKKQVQCNKKQVANDFETVTVNEIKATVVKVA